VNDKLKAVYLANGREGKAALLQYGFDAIQKNPAISKVKEMEMMADSLLGNRFDKALLADRVGPNPIDDINDLLGTYYLQKGQWETALEVFQRVPAARRDGYGTYSPFSKQFNDRVQFRPSAALSRYNKVELLERLLELEDQARRTTNDTIAARNFFNIGLAHYSMSYYGYNWHMADYFRSGSSGSLAVRRRTTDWVFPHVNAPLGNRENMSMDRAAYYFERALERAPGRESAAEAAFFAAKCQRNMHYAAGSPGPRPFTYFRLLKEVYFDTKFYQMAVEECRTFAWYAGL
jgi:tetratricopeptide (TPR) repeat protein